MKFSALAEELSRLPLSSSFTLPLGTSDLFRSVITTQMRTSSMCRTHLGYGSVVPLM